MRRQSKKRRDRMAEARPIRQGLIDRVGECELCGASPERYVRRGPRELSQLCCHEIANGPHRNKALDKPYAILVLCWYCNGHAVTSKRKWPEAKQLALLARSRPEDFDVEAFCRLINPNAPNRVTYEEVIREMVGMTTIKGVEECTLLNIDEVATLLRVNRKTVWSWIQSKELRAIDVSAKDAARRQWRVEPKDLILFSKSRATVEVQEDVTGSISDEALQERIRVHEEAKRRGREIYLQGLKKKNPK